MRRRNAIAAVLALLLVAAAYWWVRVNTLCGDCDGGVDIATADPPPAPADFDYYVLALSWSPSYCEAEATDRDRMQCGGRPFHFVVHGLWPQREMGRLEACTTETPRVPDALIDTLLDIMPSRGLIGYEWRSHGSCTGLNQDDYFATVRRAFAMVDIPDAFEVPGEPRSVAPGEIARAFVAANSSLALGQIVVTCDEDGRLEEVRLCLTKELAFRSCGNHVKSAICRRDSVRMPPVRGR